MAGMEAPRGPVDNAPSPGDVSTTNVQGRGEIFVDEGKVVVAFHLPELNPEELDYRVGTRTLSLWSIRPGFEFRTIVVLPLWVNPHAYVLRHQNGVYEFLVEPNQPVPPVAA